MWRKKKSKKGSIYFSLKGKSWSESQLTETYAASQQRKYSKTENRIKTTKKLLKWFVLYSARTEANGKQIWAQFKNTKMTTSDHGGKAFFVE